VHNFTVREYNAQPQDYDLSKLRVATAKRAIKRVDVHRLLDYETSNKINRLAVDIFNFSYLCGGINFSDICLLTTDNIRGDRLTYARKKTGKEIRVKLTERAFEIVNRYSGNAFLFPVLKGNTADWCISQKRKRVNSVLREIGKELNLPIKLTTYVARHSFATVLKYGGVPISVISQALGHNSERTTAIYLDSFPDKEMDKIFDIL
jgi:integrase